VLDKIPAFNALLPEARKFINMALSVALALGAYAFITYVPPELFTAIDPWFKVAAGVIALYSGQQVVHELTKPD
jgi:hypothetical protein